MEPVEPTERLHAAGPLEGRGEAESASAVDVASTSPGVALALQRLGDLRAAPLAAHPDVFQAIHGDLQRALAETDSG